MEGVMCFVRHNEKFLLGIESKESPYKGKWRLLGGKVEEGETIEQTAKRELLEEAGISVKVIKHLGETGGSYKSINIHLFLTDYLSGKLNPKLNEISELNYFTLEEVQNLDLDEMAKLAFKEYSASF